MKVEMDFMFLDDKAEDIASHEQGDMSMSLTKSKDMLKKNCDIYPNPKIHIMLSQ